MSIKSLLPNQVKIGATTGSCMNFARELGLLPPNICTPKYLSDTAKTLAKNDKCKVKILGESQMKKLGMNALLAVGQGSDYESQFIVLEYQGGQKNDPPICLLGKGVTFDTGGISLKTRDGMPGMKIDMGGASTVLATFKACVELGLKVNLLVAVATVEKRDWGACLSSC